MKDQIASQNSTMSKLLQSTDEKAMDITIFDAQTETAPSTEKKRKPETERLIRQDMEAEKVALQTLHVEDAAEFYATMSDFSRKDHDLK